MGHDQLSLTYSPGFASSIGAIGIGTAVQLSLGAMAGKTRTGTYPRSFKFHGVNSKANTKSGHGGPCLTDAAQEAALDEPLVFVAATLRSERIPQR
jgi:hypothetical protein